MIITIDRAGRIVVPKALRDRFGLYPGTELDIEAGTDGLRLRARESALSFVEKEGVLVHHGAGSRPRASDPKGSTRLTRPA